MCTATVQCILALKIIHWVTLAIITNLKCKKYPSREVYIIFNVTNSYPLLSDTGACRPSSLGFLISSYTVLEQLLISVYVSSPTYTFDVLQC